MGFKLAVKSISRRLIAVASDILKCVIWFVDHATRRVHVYLSVCVSRVYHEIKFSSAAGFVVISCDLC